VEAQKSRVKRLAQGQYETDAHFGVWHFAIKLLSCCIICHNKETVRGPITKFTDGKNTEKKNIKEKMCCVMQMQRYQNVELW
jgi:hypothetical protein